MTKDRLDKKIEKVSPQTLKGFRDLAPEEVSGRNHILACAREVAQAHDFEEIATPFLEYKQVLLGEGGETDKQVYLFEDSGGRQVGLRYDLTIPFSRYVAANQNTLRMPFKKFQAGTVFRGEKPQKGRYREFVQADFDVIGSKDWRADVEVVQCLSLVLKKVLLEVGGDQHSAAYEVALSHRQILAAILRKGLGLKLASSADIPPTMFIALDKLHKIGPQKTAELMLKAASDAEVEVKFDMEGEAGVGLKNIETFLTELPALSEKTQADPGFLTSYLAAEPESELDLELSRFAQTLQVLQQLGVPIKVDWSIARGLGYYTGVVFETTLTSLPELGSICSGGRYDQLCGRFGKGDLPGVGGSVGVDRLLAADLWKPKTEAKILVATADKEAQSYALLVAESLRQSAAKPVHVYLGSPKLAKQLQFAAKHGFEAVAIVGQKEMQTKSYTLKTLATGVQETMKI